MQTNQIRTRRSRAAQRRVGLVVIGLALLTVGVARSLAAPIYSVTDLGTLGGDQSEASAINGAGHVVGWSTTSGGATRAFLHTGGAMTDLGTLPGGSDSYATGINDQGHVVGYGGINEYGPQFREWRQGFVWRTGAMQSLGALHCPCSFNQRYGTSAAYAISGAGEIVGDSATVRGEAVRHAFSWQNGAMQDIGGGPPVLAVSNAFAINASGQIAGVFDGRAALWQGGSRQDLGVLPGHAASAARGINARGDVVGDSWTQPSEPRAFLWRAGSMHDLGTLPGDGASRANGVNAAGQVVGWSRAADGSRSRAFVWQGGAMTDLNDALPPGSGWVLTSAAAINTAGQIVGVGVHDGRTLAFLLTPLAPVSAVFSAVLPSSRSVRIGSWATAFATVINPGADVARACRITPMTPLPAEFSFQTTDPATNVTTGSANAPVDIPAGQSQSFVIALAASAAVPPTDVELSFGCANTAPAPVNVGINTLAFSAGDAAVADVVALAATTSHDGIVHIAPPSEAGAFAVATVNLGVGGTITAVLDLAPGMLAVDAALCQTDPVTGQCASELGPAVSTRIELNGTPTFAVFVRAREPLPFDPATHRIFVRFKDAAGVIRGATSVAVRTSPAGG